MSELKKSLNEALNMTGLLFQPHPEIDGWETTRPGAYTGEVVAFQGKVFNPSFGRLSLRYFAAGETDEDGYEYGSDTWIVETQDRGEYLWEPDQYHDREEAVDRMVEIMRDVADSRSIDGR